VHFSPEKHLGNTLKPATIGSVYIRSHHHSLLASIVDMF